MLKECDIAVGIYIEGLGKRISMLKIRERGFMNIYYIENSLIDIPTHS